MPLANGREALLKLEENLFDIVLVDYKMPEMDGLQTLKEIRKTLHGSSGGDDDRLRDRGDSCRFHEGGGA